MQAKGKVCQQAIFMHEAVTLCAMLKHSADSSVFVPPTNLALLMLN